MRAVTAQVGKPTQLDMCTFSLTNLFSLGIIILKMHVVAAAQKDNLLTKLPNAWTVPLANSKLCQCKLFVKIAKLESIQTC